jgi:predicted nucleotidyltransferase
MNYGLKDETIESIRNILREYPEVEKVILYGSRAKGNFKPASDVDLTFIGDSIDQTILNEISWELDDLLLPYTFDLSIYSHIDSSDLLDHVQRVGILFYRREE